MNKKHKKGCTAKEKANKKGLIPVTQDQPLVFNGRHVGFRTPDLYRVKVALSP